MRSRSFVPTIPKFKIRLKFDLDAPAPNFEREWNLPPTDPMLVAIRSTDGNRTLKMMRWGLLPHWAKDEKIAFSTFNARSEDFTTKPARLEIRRRNSKLHHFDLPTKHGDGRAARSDASDSRRGRLADVAGRIACDGWRTIGVTQAMPESVCAKESPVVLIKRRLAIAHARRAMVRGTLQRVDGDFHNRAHSPSKT